MKQCFPVGGEPNEDGIIQEFRADGKGFGIEKKPLFDAFVGANLMDTVRYQKQVSRLGTGFDMIDHVGYKFSSDGEKFLRPAELDKGFFNTGKRQLCYATAEVIDVTNFTEPAEVMGVKASNVKFTYRLKDVASWASDPTIVANYNWLPQKISAPSLEDDEDMVLTNNGWVHHKEVSR